MSSIVNFNLKKLKKTSTVWILCYFIFFSVFIYLFIYCVNNLMKMILLQFVAFAWPNLCSLDLSLVFIVLVGGSFVSGICKLKP